MLGCCFPLRVFGVLGFHSSPPPSGGGSWETKYPKWEKLEYCNTIKIVLYKFVNIFYKNLFTAPPSTPTTQADMRRELI